MMASNDHMLVQTAEPFLASLYNEADNIIDNSFIKPRDLSSGFYPSYHNVYLPHGSSGFTTIGPTPSPSPYSEQENDPLYRARIEDTDNKHISLSNHGREDYLRVGASNGHKMLGYNGTHKQKDINQSNDLEKILVSDSFTLDLNSQLHSIDDTEISPIDYPQTSQDITLSQALISHYRSNGEFYPTDGSNSLSEELIPQGGSFHQVGMVHGSESSYPHIDGVYTPQYLNIMSQTCDSEKKLSESEMYQYIPNWNSLQAEPNQMQVIPQIMNAQSLSNVNDFDLADPNKNASNALHLAFSGATKPFPINDHQPQEPQVRELRGRKNSSFREYQSGTASSLPISMASEIEQEFMAKDKSKDEDAGRVIDVVSDDNNDKSFTSLTPLTTTPNQIVFGVPDGSASYSVMDPNVEDNTVNKMRSVFMSFVEHSAAPQPHSKASPEEDAEKNKLLMDMMCKSLILENSDGVQDAIVVNQHQIEAAVLGHEQYIAMGQSEPHPPGKRYSLRKSETKSTPRVTRARSLKQPSYKQEEVSKGNLGVSLTRTTGNKCTYCGKTFPSNSSLNVHMNLHTGEKPHVCEVCHRGFGDPSNLKRHFRIHTRSRPYSCHLCPTSFNQSSHLVRHIRSHSQRGSQKSCRFCLVTFPHYSNLRRHIEKCPQRKKKGAPAEYQHESQKRGRPPGNQSQLYLNYDDQDVFYRVQENSIITSSLNPNSDSNRQSENSSLIIGANNSQTEPYLELPNQETYMRLVSMRGKCCT